MNSEKVTITETDSQLSSWVTIYWGPGQENLIFSLLNLMMDFMLVISLPLIMITNKGQTPGNLVWFRISGADSQLSRVTIYGP